MKLIKKCPKLYTCDECEKNIAGQPAVLLGEKSIFFKEDARQTLICFDCIRKSFSLFNEEPLVEFEEWKEKSKNCIRKEGVLCLCKDGMKRFCDIAICTGIEK